MWNPQLFNEEVKKMKEKRRWYVSPSRIEYSIGKLRILTNKWDSEQLLDV